MNDVYTVEENDVVGIGMNIMFAGVGGTPSIMSVLLALLVNHQDIQQRAYHDIMEEIGDRYPTCEDKEKLPFIQAIILETLRYGTVIPVGVPHYTSNHTELGGYLIPKGTMVFQNTWSISHDPRYMIILKNLGVDQSWINPKLVHEMQNSITLYMLIKECVAVSKENCPSTDLILSHTSACPHGEVKSPYEEKNHHNMCHCTIFLI